MHFLSQIASAPSPDSLISWDTALKTVGWIALAYMGRGYQKMQKEMTEWRVYLFGIKGDNGLNGNVKTLMDEREERLKAGTPVKGGRRETDA